MLLGNKIIELRTEKGLTQDKLAKEIGVSQKAIDFWERNVNEPRAGYIKLLADYFKVSCDYLLDDEAKTPF